MKTLHLICNAHLDPIWQWEWQEGASAALSTFRSAAELCEEYDYIFCHNEVTLYRYIEEYAPSLFARIRKLVERGKWHIMGGWYLQPDCNMPSGESIARHILYGKKYFLEKFGKEPTVAANFDSFGHSAGLPQILKKCGQSGYIVTRPYFNQLDTRERVFLWEGVDGSRVKTARCSAYNTFLGRAGEQIEEYVLTGVGETDLKLWGVGNHGGGPSRKDLSDIAALQKKYEAKGICIKHGTPESFFKDVEPATVFKGALISCMPGCYVSMSHVKRAHVELENQLYLTEKMLSVAALSGVLEYPHAPLNGAQEDLLNLEFHDVLPGSCVKAGERNGLLLADHGLLELERLRARALFALAASQPPAAEGEFPVLVFNPAPYECTENIEVEFSLADQNWDESRPSRAVVRDAFGNLLPCQAVKEESTIHLDWRKRVIFEGKLAPLGLTRFSIYLEPFRPSPVSEEYSFENKYFCAKIDPASGLISSLVFGGAEYARGGLCSLASYRDNADPWAMSERQLRGLGTDRKSFALQTKPHGVFEGMKPVQIIENGCLCYAVEAFFECEDTVARAEYRFYKNKPYFDVNVNLFLQNADRLVRLHFPLAEEGAYIGQTAYGTYPLYADGRECVAQRFTAVRGQNGKCFAVFNRGTYGSRYERGEIGISLARGAGYCVHPIEERSLMPEGRYIKRMDESEHDYNFRVCVCEEGELERLSLEFNQPYYALNAFPIPGEKRPERFFCEIGDKNITLSAFKQSESGEYVLRLFNNAPYSRATRFTLADSTITLGFARYEVKTLVYDGKTLSESEKMLL